MLFTRLRGCRGEENCARSASAWVYSVEPECGRTISQCTNLPKGPSLREVQSPIWRRPLVEPTDYIVLARPAA